jgi:tRNA threonylcarbamoyladenosine biosynthesis protein TsaB
MLLAIDTCGNLGTVALAHLASGDPEILGQTELPGKTYSAQLLPAIRDLLIHHNVTIARIATIVVTNGPGSFTGIRIGLSTAKGLAEPSAIPIVAVSRLAVLAHKAQNQNREIQAAALDASRHEFYFGDYSGPARAESLLTHDPFTQLATALEPQLAICEESLLDALLFALPRIRARDFDDPVTLDGNYLRRSDAEIFSKAKLHPAQT